MTLNMPFGLYTKIALWLVLNLVLLAALGFGIGWYVLLGNGNGLVPAHLFSSNIENSFRLISVNLQYRSVFTWQRLLRQNDRGGALRFHLLSLETGVLYDDGIPEAVVRAAKSIPQSSFTLCPDPDLPLWDSLRGGFFDTQQRNMEAGLPPVPPAIFIRTGSPARYWYGRVLYIPDKNHQLHYVLLALETLSLIHICSMPKVNISIKPSALYSRANPVALEDSVEGIYRRLAPLYRKTIGMGGFMCIDMEQLKYREITVELFKRLRADPEFRDYPHLCLVQQAYLKDCEKGVAGLIAWAREEKLPIALRLVKGAYWDAETVLAKQYGWPIPVWTRKPESDMAHERISRLILENHDIVYFACASHNVRSISAVMEYARELNVPEDRYEFQVLYGMAEPVRKGLRNVAGRVRLYCPYGKLIPGMAYLSLIHIL